MDARPFFGAVEAAADSRLTFLAAVATFSVFFLRSVVDVAAFFGLGAAAGLALVALGAFAVFVVALVAGAFLGAAADALTLVEAFLRG